MLPFSFARFKHKYGIELSIYKWLITDKGGLKLQFSKDLEKIWKNPKHLTTIIRWVSLSIVLITYIDQSLQLRVGLRGACSDDVSSLLYVSLDYISTLTEPFNPPLSSCKKKDVAHGFNSLDLTQLLIPLSYLAEFDKEPEEYIHIFLTLVLQTASPTASGPKLTFVTGNSRFIQPIFPSVYMIQTHSILTTRRLVSSQAHL